MKPDLHPPLPTLDDGPPDTPSDGWDRTPSRLAVGDVVDRYEVEALIGEGGVASVYRVRHRTLGSLHALKVLHSFGGDLADRLLAEGRVQGNLDHPHVVRVQDTLDAHGSPALLMEYVAGRTLAARLREGRPSLAEAERIFLAILDGVGHAHALGVVHRDLKPANVLLTDDGDVPKVGDFGIAKHLSGDDGLLTTATGRFMGTPAYMAPEQIRDPKSVDARADIFALGVILYELCCGQRPFQGEDVLSLLNAVSNAEYTRPDTLNPTLPPRIVRAIERCLETDPANRFASCSALRAGLQPTAPQPSPEMRPRGVGPLVVASVLAAVLGAGIAWTLKPAPGTTVDQLRAAAWERATRAPGEALALLRAAEVAAREQGAGSVLTVEVLDRLEDAGAAVQIIPARDQVVGVALHEASGHLATGHVTGQYAVWSLDDGRELHRSTSGVGTMLRELHLVANGTRLLLRPWYGFGEGAGYGAPRSIAVPSGEVVHTFAHGEYTRGFAMSADERWLVTTGTGHDGSVTLWDTRTGTPKTTANFTHLHPQSLALSPSGDLLVMGSRPDGVDGEGTLVGADTPSLVPRFEIKMGSSAVSTRSLFASDGSTVLISTEGTLALVEPDGALRARLEEVAEDPIGIAPDGDRIVYRRESSLILRDGQLREVALLDSRSRPEKLAFSADGRWLAAGFLGGDVILFDAESGQSVRSLPGHTSLVLALALGRDGTLVSGSRDGTARVYRDVLPAAEAVERVILGRPGDDSGLLPGGLLVSRRGSGPVRLRTSARELGEFAFRGSSVRCVGLSRDHRRFAAGGVTQSGTTLYALDGGAPRELVHFASGGRHTCGLSADGEVLVRATDQGRIEGALLVDGEPTTWSAEGPTFPRSMSISDDGGLVAVAGMQGDLRVGSGREPDGTWRRLATRKSGWPLTLVSAGGEVVFAGTWEGDGLIWDRGHGPPRVLAGHDDAIIRAALSHDGGRLITGSWDRTARIWDTAGGTELHALRGHKGDVTAVTIDGDVAWTGSKDRTVRAWDATTGALLAIHRGHGGGVVELEPDGEGGAWSKDSQNVALRWPPPDGGAVDPLLASGAATNLRVCAGTNHVVPVIPYPEPASVFAPEETCP